MILASDAVSKWILGGGGSQEADAGQRWDAFQKVYNMPVEDWPKFIEDCREAQVMVNDDSTALILTLLEDGSSDEGAPLGWTFEHTEAIIAERKVAFDKAREEQNSELVAVFYGDGRDLKPLLPEITEEEIEHPRKVADALREVLQAFRQAQNTPGLVSKMQPVWDQYSSILEKEKCAENIRETLRRNGVNLDGATAKRLQEQLARRVVDSPNQVQPDQPKSKCP